MTFKPNLTAGDTISNAELAKIFRCGTQGGMRRSHRTNSLVIVSDHTKYIHQDRWVSDTMVHYTGMGLEGDQSINYLQNKTISESLTNGVTSYLFEVYEPRTYLFRGKVILAAQPFKEVQPDKNGKPRTVWIFPLRVVGSDSEFRAPEELVARKLEQEAQRNCCQLTIDGGVVYV